jgi:nucleotide-binding universal stress UspA family protein
MEHPMSNISASSIVVGLDGAPASLAALRWALAEAARSTSAVEVVHCWGAHSLRDLSFGSTHELRIASDCMLDNEVSAALRDTEGIVAVLKTSLNQRPAAALIERSDGADLLVLGAHRHTALRDFASAPVATACRRHAKCPVVIVDADGTATRYEMRSPVVAAH